MFLGMIEQVFILFYYYYFFYARFKDSLAIVLISRSIEHLEG